ncbi:voltage-dependent calcium channel gamma-5 subunit isoform X3 [Pelobates fuscus]|uniref:voltage-dependent calcium channel gamma-5 subunit isoform X3 n=1 Tax=Pelobates fuscus TaxID=191477 RepID=UPI002FE47532
MPPLAVCKQPSLEPPSSSTAPHPAPRPPMRWCRLLLWGSRFLAGGKAAKFIQNIIREISLLHVTEIFSCTISDLMLCGMGACSRKALTLLSSVFAVCGLGLLGIAVSTDYWLYLEEGIILPQNQTTEIKMSLHSGLWRVCFLAVTELSLTAGEEQGRCFTIEYVMPMNMQMTSESTISVLSLSLVVGLVLYISSINDEILNRTKDSETYFSYKYGWSFAFAAISFLLTESAGVMSVYLFMKRYTAEDAYRPHPGFYRPRLSNCSDYSGQFLHPEAWVRGRSPSDISSEASLQMNSNYPALLKCPDYDQMSSSPC